MFADNLQGAAKNRMVYQTDKITKSIRKLTEINLEACQVLMSQLKD
jgi:hypothetical protein